jgi:hypothetical protein
MDRIDALITRSPPRSTKKGTARQASGIERSIAIVQSLSSIPQSWERKPPVPNTVVPRTITLGTHSGVEFERLRSKPGAIYENGEFDKCRFAGGVLSPASESAHWDPAARCTVRRVVVTRCSTMYPIIGPAILEDLTIDRLDTERDAFFIRGAAFKHVTIKGNVGRILIYAEASSMPVERNDRAVMQANLAYYKTVDWALDIREIRALEFSVCSVPVDLVRYDPEHQAVVRLTKIRKRWAEIKKVCAGCVFAYSMADLRTDPYCDGVVLCVPLRAKKEKVAGLTAVLKRLRKLGIADPV